jgi:hypothetical protein
LLAGHDPRSLLSLVNDLRLLRANADKVAYEQPSPDALRAYRRAARELAEAEAALLMLPTAPGGAAELDTPIA